MEDNESTPDICIFYLCVHKRLHERVGLSRYMNKKDFYKLLGETYHIPKPLRVIILKEMAKLKMLEETNHRHIKVLPLVTDPEININRFYKELGFFD